MKPLQASILLVLFSFLFPFCKKEVDTSSNSYTSAGTFDLHEVRSLKYFPEMGSDSTDLNSDVEISLDFQEGLNVDGGSIKVLKNNKEVAGKTKVSKTEITFTPDQELSPLTNYIVRAQLVLKKIGDDSRQVTRNGDARLPDLKDTTHLVVSWNFTTRGNYSYIMGRTNRWVTNSYRDGNKIIQMGDFLYSYGGWTADPLQSYNDVYRSSGDLTQWERLPDASWEGRHTYGIGKKDSTLFIFGGDILSTIFDVWKSVDGINFTPVSQDLGSLLGPRILYGACAHNSKLYIMGGQSGLGMDSAVTDVWMSANGGIWRQIAKDLPFLGKNISGSVTSFNGRIWVVGGGYYRSNDLFQRYTNSVYSSSDGVNWKREPDAPWTPRQYGDLCVWNNRLWMVGGYNEQNLSDIWYMTADGDWHKFETPPEFDPRHASGVGVYNDKLVIVCGNYHNDCWVIEKL